MKKFLASEDAAFYHITRRETWENAIRQEGLSGDEYGRIFVSRTNDEGVLASITINQILKIGEEPDLVVLKLSQPVNGFRFEDFTFDHQANELTLPFHNIIQITTIPLENIEFEGYIRMTLSALGDLANKADADLVGSPLFAEALDIIYEMPSRLQYKLQATKEEGIWEFGKRYDW